MYKGGKNGEPGGALAISVLHSRYIRYPPTCSKKFGRSLNILPVNSGDQTGYISGES